MNQITKSEAVTRSSAPTDRATTTKTIYDVSASEIFWRNLLAGMARALGAVILYSFILLIGVNIFVNFVYPLIEPFISQYSQALETFTQLSPAGAANSNLFHLDLQNITK